MMRYSSEFFSGNNIFSFLIFSKFEKSNNLLVEFFFRRTISFGKHGIEFVFKPEDSDETIPNELFVLLTFSNISFSEKHEK